MTKPIVDSPLSFASPKKDEFSLPYLALFGMGGMAMAIGSSGVGVLATPIYQMTLGVNPAWLGIALALPRIWDAFTDPLMGDISDNFRSKYGRRRPFVFFGAILMAIFVATIWMVPEGWSESAKLAWFITTSILFYTCSTIFTVPLASLYYEATPDYDERTRVMGASTFWNRVGELSVIWLIPAAQLAIFSSMMSGVQIVTWVAAVVLIMIPGLISAFVGRERFAEVAKKQDKVKFWVSMKSAFSNKAFLILAGIVILTVLTGYLASQMDYYLLVYYVCGGDMDEGFYWKAILTTGYAIVGFGSIPILNFLSKKLGKKETLIAVLCLYIVGAVVRWWLFRPGAGWLIAIDPFLGGGSLWVAMNMVIGSMFADLCDEDELNNGQRREGIFGAAFSWLLKIGVSLSLVIVGYSLNFVEFDVALGGDQTAETFTKMRIFLTAVPAIAALLSIYMLTRFPIDRETSKETRRLLELRRGEV